MMAVSLIGTRLRSWLVHGTMLLVLMSGLLSAGSAYAFCPHAKKTMRHDDCCAKHRARQRMKEALQAPTDPGPELKRRACCEARRVDALPAVDGTAPPTVQGHGPGGAATLPTVRSTVAEAPSTWLPVAPVPGQTAVPIRAGPQSAAERCVWLQVFLR